VHKFTFSSPSLLKYYMYTASIREEGEFVVRKERFNIEKEQ
jgi:hypothetical protein